jgi:hypothetical protein
VSLVSVAAERQDGRMLEQQQLIGDAIVGAGHGETALEVPRVAIRDPTEPRRFQLAASRERGTRRFEGDHAGTIAGGR